MHHDAKVIAEESSLAPDQSKSGIEIELYTDGACRGNPGPGGWAYILRHLPTGKEVECNGGERDTTNNRMELQAVIEGLAALKRPCRIELFIDSEYVRQGLESWVAKWKKNGWRRKTGKGMSAVKNDDLWKRLDELASRHQMKLTRVAGHSGHVENDRCDELAVEAAEAVR